MLNVKSTRDPGVEYFHQSNGYKKLKSINAMGALRERNLKKVPWVTDSDSNETWFLSSHAKMMQSKDEVSSLKNSNCDPTQQGFLS